MKTYFIDTNFLLRLLTDRESDQGRQAYKTFSQAARGEIKIFTSVVVFFEVFWVLASFYNQSKKSQLKYLQQILKMSFLEIENRSLLEKGLELFAQHSIELEDCYNLAYAKVKPATQFLTFDKKLQKLI